ncbi:hypothetical protein [Halpernia sp. GG3]
MENQTKQILAIVTGLTGIIISNIIGHFSPPFSILWTPIVLTGIIAGVNYPLYKADFTKTIIYNYGLLLFNDLFIRFYAGGTHDKEGKGWIFLLFAIAFIIATITMVIYAYSAGKVADTEIKNKRNNFLTVIISAIVTGFIYALFIADI